MARCLIELLYDNLRFLASTQPSFLGEEANFPRSILFSGRVIVYRISVAP